jgi:hypothetical protein
MEAQQVITGEKKPGKSGEAARGKAADKTGTLQQTTPSGKVGRVVPFPTQEGVKKRKRA